MTKNIPTFAQLQTIRNVATIVRNQFYLKLNIAERATFERPFEYETAHGTLKVFKHETDYGVQYNVYFFKHSMIRRFINFVDSLRWT
ncbi:hypothetical protein UFOVP453_31 [uncultured Caudovirales phage]|uniref:Uncharacterized protein n=1 Tax=uncultured Caudovirales phage TaxID=2100421 RepID=A0A6J5MBB9_9CAUD|nr:hypothetical protein UFOVP453_31 [uncultured Caudovirales phage]